MEHEDDPFVASHQREHPNRNAVILVLRNRTGELLLVRTRRLPNYWQALGGGIEPDDLSAKDAVAREVREEAGIVIPPEDMAHLCDAPYDFGVGTIHAFVAHLYSETRLSIDSGEIADARWFTLADAMALPMLPAMVYILHAVASTTEPSRPI